MYVYRLSSILLVLALAVSSAAAERDRVPELVATLPTQAAVLGIAVSSDGTMLAVGGEEHHLALWNLKKEKLKESTPRWQHYEPGSGAAVPDVAFLVGDKFFVSCGRDGTIRWFRVQDDEEDQVLTSRRRSKPELKPEPKHQVLKVGTAVEPGTREAVNALQYKSMALSSAFSADDKGPWVACLGRRELHRRQVQGVSGEVNITTRGSLAALDLRKPTKKYYMEDVAISPDGKYILAVGTVAAVWRAHGLTDPTSRFLLAGSEEVSFSAAAFRPVSAGPTLEAVLANEEGRCVLWEVSTTRADESSAKPEDYFTQDGQRLLRPTYNQGRLLREFVHPTLGRAHEGVVAAVAFSSDGQLLATGAKDVSYHYEGSEFIETPQPACIRLWDVNSGSLLAEYGDQSATCVAFTPDGKFLISGHKDHKIRIWSVSEQAIDAVAARGRSTATQ